MMRFLPGLLGCFASPASSSGNEVAEQGQKVESPAQTSDAKDADCFLQVVSMLDGDQGFQSCGHLSYSCSGSDQDLWACGSKDLKLLVRAITPDRLATLDPYSRDELSSRLVMLRTEAGQGPLTAQSASPDEMGSVDVSMAVADAVQWYRASKVPPRKSGSTGEIVNQSALPSGVLAPMGAHPTPPWLFLEMLPEGGSVSHKSPLGKDPSADASVMRELMEANPDCMQHLWRVVEALLLNGRSNTGGGTHGGGGRGATSPLKTSTSGTVRGGTHSGRVSHRASASGAAPLDLWSQAISLSSPSSIESSTSHSHRKHPLVKNHYTAMQASSCYLLNTTNGLMEPSLVLSFHSGASLPAIDQAALNTGRTHHSVRPMPSLSDPTPTQPADHQEFKDEPSIMRGGPPCKFMLSASNKNIAVRGLAILDSVPVMTTCMTLNGSQLIFQNEESILYWGDMQLTPPDAFQDVNPLQRLFGKQPELLGQVMSAIQQGISWKNVLKVPASYCFDTFEGQMSMSSQSGHIQPRDNSGGSYRMMPAELGGLQALPELTEYDAETSSRCSSDARALLRSGDLVGTPNSIPSWYGLRRRSVTSEDEVVLSSSEEEDYLEEEEEEQEEDKDSGGGMKSMWPMSAPLVRLIKRKVPAPKPKLSVTPENEELGIASQSVPLSKLKARKTKSTTPRTSMTRQRTTTMISSELRKASTQGLIFQPSNRVMSMIVARDMKLQTMKSNVSRSSVSRKDIAMLSASKNSSFNNDPGSLGSPSELRLSHSRPLSQGLRRGMSRTPVYSHGSFPESRALYSSRYQPAVRPGLSPNNTSSGSTGPGLSSSLSNYANSIIVGHGSNPHSRSLLRSGHGEAAVHGESTLSNLSALDMASDIIHSNIISTLDCDASSTSILPLPVPEWNAPPSDFHLPPPPLPSKLSNGTYGAEHDEYPPRMTIPAPIRVRMANGPPLSSTSHLTANTAAATAMARGSALDVPPPSASPFTNSATTTTYAADNSASHSASDYVSTFTHPATAYNSTSHSTSNSASLFINSANTKVSANTLVSPSYAFAPPSHPPLAFFTAASATNTSSSNFATSPNFASTHTRLSAGQATNTLSSNLATTHPNRLSAGQAILTSSSNFASIHPGRPSTGHTHPSHTQTLQPSKAGGVASPPGPPPLRVSNCNSVASSEDDAGQHNSISQNCAVGASGDDPVRPQSSSRASSSVVAASFANTSATSEADDVKSLGLSSAGAFEAVPASSSTVAGIAAGVIRPSPKLSQATTSAAHKLASDSKSEKKQRMPPRASVSFATLPTAGSDSSVSITMGGDRKWSPDIIDHSSSLGEPSSSPRIFGRPRVTFPSETEKPSGGVSDQWPSLGEPSSSPRIFGRPRVTFPSETEKPSVGVGDQWPSLGELSSSPRIPGRPRVTFPLEDERPSVGVGVTPRSFPRSSSNPRSRMSASGTERDIPQFNQPPPWQTSATSHMVYKAVTGVAAPGALSAVFRSRRARTLGQLSLPGDPSDEPVSRPDLPDKYPHLVSPRGLSFSSTAATGGSGEAGPYARRSTNPKSPPSPLQAPLDTPRNSPMSNTGPTPNGLGSPSFMALGMMAWQATKGDHLHPATVQLPSSTRQRSVPVSPHFSRLGNTSCTPSSQQVSIEPSRRSPFFHSEPDLEDAHPDSPTLAGSRPRAGLSVETNPLLAEHTATMGVPPVLFPLGSNYLTTGSNHSSANSGFVNSMFDVDVNSPNLSSPRGMMDEGAEDSTLAEEPTCWHEVHVMPMRDPVSGEPAMLILQTDITIRAELETRMAELTEAQLTMLENMFPRHVLEFMVAAQDPSQDMSALACSHDGVTIMFMDIVGFTSMSKEVSSKEVMGYLNELFTILDDLVDQFGIYKVDTAGDCYIVAGGLMEEDEDGLLTLQQHPSPEAGARHVMDFTEAFMSQLHAVNYPHTGEPTVVRVGIHTGACVSGLIGTKLPKFSLWGDTTNTASRMESTSKPGCVQVSEVTLSLLDIPRQSQFHPTGGVEVKGKGMMQTYIWYPPDELPDFQLGPSSDNTVPQPCRNVSTPGHHGWLMTSRDVHGGSGTFPQDVPSRAVHSPGRDVHSVPNNVYQGYRSAGGDSEASEGHSHSLGRASMPAYSTTLRHLRNTLIRQTSSNLDVPCISPTSSAIHNFRPSAPQVMVGDPLLSRRTHAGFHVGSGGSGTRQLQSRSSGKMKSMIALHRNPPHGGLSTPLPKLPTSPSGALSLRRSATELLGYFELDPYPYPVPGDGFSRMQMPADTGVPPSYPPRMMGPAGPWSTLSAGQGSAGAVGMGMAGGLPVVLSGSEGSECGSLVVVGSDGSIPHTEIDMSILDTDMSPAAAAAAASLATQVAFFRGSSSRHSRQTSVATSLDTRASSGVFEHQPPPTGMSHWQGHWHGMRQGVGAGATPPMAGPSSPWHGPGQGAGAGSTPPMAGPSPSWPRPGQGVGAGATPPMAGPSPSWPRPGQGSGAGAPPPMSGLPPPWYGPGQGAGAYALVSPRERSSALDYLGLTDPRGRPWMDREESCTEGLLVTGEMSFESAQEGWPDTATQGDWVAGPPPPSDGAQERCITLPLTQSRPKSVSPTIRTRHSLPTWPSLQPPAATSPTLCNSQGWPIPLPRDTNFHRSALLTPSGSAPARSHPWLSPRGEGLSPPSHLFSLGRRSAPTRASSTSFHRATSNNVNQYAPGAPSPHRGNTSLNSSAALTPIGFGTGAVRATTAAGLSSGAGLSLGLSILNHDMISAGSSARSRMKSPLSGEVDSSAPSPRSFPASEGAPHVGSLNVWRSRRKSLPSASMYSTNGNSNKVAKVKRTGSCTGVDVDSERSHSNASSPRTSSHMLIPGHLRNPNWISTMVRGKTRRSIEREHSYLSKVSSGSAASANSYVSHNPSYTPYVNPPGPGPSKRPRSARVTHSVAGERNFAKGAGPSEYPQSSRVTRSVAGDKNFAEGAGLSEYQRSSRANRSVAGDKNFAKGAGPSEYPQSSRVTRSVAGERNFAEGAGPSENPRSSRVTRSVAGERTFAEGAGPSEYPHSSRVTHSVAGERNFAEGAGPSEHPRSGRVTRSVFGDNTNAETEDFYLALAPNPLVEAIMDPPPSPQGGARQKMTNPSRHSVPTVPTDANIADSPHKGLAPRGGGLSGGGRKARRQSHRSGNVDLFRLVQILDTPTSADAHPSTGGTVSRRGAGNKHPYSSSTLRSKDTKCYMGWIGGTVSRRGAAGNKLAYGTSTLWSKDT